MRAFFAALWLTLVLCGAALAGAQEDCSQNKDRFLRIRSCTLIIEGQAKGNKAVAYSNRGEATWGDTDKAIADYNRAIELNPNYAEAYYHRGTSYSLRDFIQFKERSRQGHRRL